KINLVREGRAVRGTAAAPQPVAMAAATGGTGGVQINNIIVLACLVLGVLVALAYWFWHKRELKNREAVVAERTVQAQKLESIIKEVEEYQQRKDNLQQRIDLINQLKQNQKGPVRIMDQISRDLPDLVWLDSMDINAGRITLSGRGLNANAIALFIENVKNDPYFEEPQVGAVSQVSAVPLVYGFDMNFAFSYAPKNAAPAAGAGTTTDTTGTTATTTGTAQ
ncbi:MAG TPA: PilN domain-containing protein, partial [Thermoanaerobaculia bacterium]|nr:PilN domain-containing protein [Thermoanaerobaculia bacterium]